MVAVDPAYGDDHTHQGELPDGGEFGAGCDGVTVPPGCQSGREGGREGGREEQGEEGRKGGREGGRVRGRVKEGSEGGEEGSKTRNGEEREERRGEGRKNNCTEAGSVVWSFRGWVAHQTIEKGHRRKVKERTTSSRGS